MAQRIKVPTVKPENRSLIPGTHMEEAENHSHQLSPDHHTCCVTCACVHTHHASTYKINAS